MHVGDKGAVGKTVKFKVLSVSYSKNRLVLLGDLTEESMHVGDKGAVVEIIEEVSELDGDSEHDSGIENGNQKEKLLELAAIVNGESSGSKRKAEDEVEDEVERKRRKKSGEESQERK